jgi:hypothetical protein
MANVIAALRDSRGIPIARGAAPRGASGGARASNSRSDGVRGVGVGAWGKRMAAVAAPGGVHMVLLREACVALEVYVWLVLVLVVCVVLVIVVCVAMVVCVGVLLCERHCR